MGNVELLQTTLCYIKHKYLSVEFFMKALIEPSQINYVILFIKVHELI